MLKPRPEWMAQQRLNKHTPAYITEVIPAKSLRKVLYVIISLIKIRSEINSASCFLECFGCEVDEEQNKSRRKKIWDEKKE